MTNLSRRLPAVLVPSALATFAGALCPLSDAVAARRAADAVRRRPRPAADERQHRHDGRARDAPSARSPSRTAASPPSDRAAGQRLSACTRTINLGGRTVVPGLIDNHNHIVLLGIRPGYHTPLESARSIADVQAHHRAPARKTAPADAFITSMGGWNPVQFAEKRLPTLAELDAAAAGHPVLVFQGFTGPAATNTPGRAFFTVEGHRGQRHRSDCRQRAVDGGAQRAARRADVRRPQARHGGRDGLLGQRRRDHQHRHGRLQPAGHARSAGVVRGRHAGQRRPVPHVRRGAGAARAKAG